MKDQNQISESQEAYIDTILTQAISQNTKEHQITIVRNEEEMLGEAIRADSEFIIKNLGRGYGSALLLVSFLCGVKMSEKTREKTKENVIAQYNRFANSFNETKRKATIRLLTQQRYEDLFLRAVDGGLIDLEYEASFNAELNLENISRAIPSVFLRATGNIQERHPFSKHISSNSADSTHKKIKLAIHLKELATALSGRPPANEVYL